MYIVVISDSDASPRCDWWIEDMVLFAADHMALKSGDLTANIINAAQTMLKTQFPSVQGFQDTALLDNLNVHPVMRDRRSVQILHTGTQMHT